MRCVPGTCRFLVFDVHCALIHQGSQKKYILSIQEQHVNTLASTDECVQCVQFRALGAVTLDGADGEACHTYTYMLDLRPEILVSDVPPAQATGDSGKDERGKCRQRRDGPPGRKPTGHAPLCEPGGDEPPGVCGAQRQINRVRPDEPTFSEPTFSEPQPADEQRAGEQEHKGAREEEPRGELEVGGGHDRVGARLEDAVERHCGEVVRVRLEDGGCGGCAVFGGEEVREEGGEVRGEEGEEEQAEVRLEAEERLQRRRCGVQGALLRRR